MCNTNRCPYEDWTGDCTMDPFQMDKCLAELVDTDYSGDIDDYKSIKEAGGNDAA